jgi:prolyl-tRNA editing enzyme YbaK/EbsC (Cys-tRNA(Pro) deacylase)
MARKTELARITGVSTGAGNHPHGILIELPADVDASTLHNLQITITGGADGKKRHAAALVSIDELERALVLARRAIDASGNVDASAVA